MVTEVLTLNREESSRQPSTPSILFGTDFHNCLVRLDKGYIAYERQKAENIGPGWPMHYSVKDILSHPFMESPNPRLRKRQREFLRNPNNTKYFRLDIEDELALIILTQALNAEMSVITASSEPIHEATIESLSSLGLLDTYLKTENVYQRYGTNSPEEYKKLMNKLLGLKYYADDSYQNSKGVAEMSAQMEIIDPSIHGPWVFWVTHDVKVPEEAYHIPNFTPVKNLLAAARYIYNLYKPEGEYLNLSSTRNKPLVTRMRSFQPIQIPTDKKIIHLIQDFVRKLELSEESTNKLVSNLAKEFGL